MEVPLGAGRAEVWKAEVGGTVGRLSKGTDVQKAWKS